MTAPLVRLHPDGRAVVRLDGAAGRPWLAPSTSEDAYLAVEVFTDAEAQDWPAYAPPYPSVVPNAAVVPDFLRDDLRAAMAQHPSRYRA